MSLVWIRDDTGADRGREGVRILVELEDVLGAVFSRIKPSLEKINFRLFRIQSTFKQGVLTPQAFIALRKELVDLRYTLEDLPLLPGDVTKIRGGQCGVDMAS